MTIDMGNAGEGGWAAPSLARRAAAEALGTALLLATVVGSGIMAERLAGGSVGLALLANALATGAGLLALILAFGPVSGAHFNPAVTLVEGLRGGLTLRDAAAYGGAQVSGAFAGVAAAHGMFGLPLYAASAHARAGLAQRWSEVVATFGLVVVLSACGRVRPGATPVAAAAYITAAYWFTASTSFANPAVTLARAATDSFAGIRPGDVPGFIAAQVVGALVAAWVVRWMIPEAMPRRGGVA
jgi:glycerol uptake facilitator-like aquaporin